MPAIHVGNQAPTFELPDQDRQPWSLSDHLQKGPIALVFYRGDW